jgi:glycopeptide antibiotics resistance protein
MQNKRLIWLLAILGGVIGSYIPALWGVSGFTFTTLFFNTLGGLLGIWIAYRITH